MLFEVLKMLLLQFLEAQREPYNRCVKNVFMKNFCSVCIVVFTKHFIHHRVQISILREVVANYRAISHQEFRVHDVFEFKEQNFYKVFVDVFIDILNIRTHF
jgi:hypothetical protein